MEQQSAEEALKRACPWIQMPLVVSAPMRLIAGPELALEVSAAGGIGFIGPGTEPTHTASILEKTQLLLESEPRWRGLSNKRPASGVLPIGIGFFMWAGNLKAAVEAVGKYRPAAVWLFAPREGQSDLDTWIGRFHAQCPDTQVWLQVGSVSEALSAVSSPHAPDVLVVQGTDAGGHGLTAGASIISSVPEVADALNDESRKVTKGPIPLIAAGGIVDGRGAAAALALGASGAVMGTRFLASKEANIPDGYKSEVVRASDGGQCTQRTSLYDSLRGTTNWPASYNARGILNKSFDDDKAGMSFDENKKLYETALAAETQAWGPEGRLTTYAGTAVGLIHEIETASEIVTETREQAKEVLRRLSYAAQQSS